MVCYTGFQVADTACCGVGTYRGAFPCMNTTMMCDTPETHVWWDLYHPSHLANRVIADSVWNTPDDSPDFSLKSFHTLANL
jgi:phospholipase/lecithinase/hemolysin